ncbi:MAG: hypothetical protein ACFFA2_11715 [Promethearchaeota archaeon]
MDHCRGPISIFLFKRNFPNQVVSGVINANYLHLRPTSYSWDIILPISVCGQEKSRFKIRENY